MSWMQCLWCLNTDDWCHKVWIWCDVGCVLCHTCDKSEATIIIVKELIEWVWPHRCSGCDVKHSGWDARYSRLYSWNSKGDIIYIGYDVIDIMDVMSYLYRCDVIKCSCDVMHTECDVIHRVCNVIQRVGVMQLIHWVWWHSYSGCSVRYRGWDGRYNFCVVMCVMS